MQPSALSASELLERRQRRQSRRDRWWQSLRAGPGYALVGAFSLSTLLALAWAVVMSLRPSQELFTYGAWAFPREWVFKNYVDAWQEMRVGRYLLNTVVYSVVGTSGSVMLAAGAAYILARVRFRGRTLVYYLFVISLMIPSYLAMVPRYFLMKSLHLVDTYTAVFLIAWTGGLSFNLFLLINFFETLPVELEEAAFIDGASAWQIFWNIMLPLARPGLATVAIFMFMDQWNEFLTPLIYVRDASKYPLALGLQILSYNSNVTANYAKLFAGMIIFMVPILTAYLLLKRYITEGLTVGAIKG